MTAHRRALAAAVMAIGLAGCSSQPPAPDWQGNAKGSIERSVAAYLTGDTRIEAAEFDRARSEVARTGRPDLVARIELMRCAAHVASLVFDDCPGFEALRAQAEPAQRAYVDYLAGRAADVALLPPAQQTGAGAGSGDMLKAIDDPLSRLVAIGVRMRANRIDPAAITLAIDTASEQGWRRPLLAWLNVQLKRAEAAGADDDVQRLRVRIVLVEGR